MKICAAQTEPIKGDVRQNIQSHQKLIELAAVQQADLIVFPELSLTGYEPELALSLSLSPLETNALNEFQAFSDMNRISICVGMPKKAENGTCISMFIFQPFTGRQVYSKHYLYPGEEAYFISGQNLLPVKMGAHTIQFAICYEVSVPEHAETAFQNGADVYIASVMNSVNGVDKDIHRISEISRQYRMISLMANFTGRSGGYECAGKTSVWNRQGEIVGQLNNANEGIVMIDTESGEVTQKYL